MQHVHYFKRDYGDGACLEAFTFNGHYDSDDLNQYFDQAGIDWDNRYSGAGGYFQDCSVTKKGTRTIAYIRGGYEI